MDKFYKGSVAREVSGLIRESSLSSTKLKLSAAKVLHRLDASCKGVKEASEVTFGKLTGEMRACTSCLSISDTWSLKATRYVNQERENRALRLHLVLLRADWLLKKPGKNVKEWRALETELLERALKRNGLPYDIRHSLTEKIRNQALVAYTSGDTWKEINAEAAVWHVYFNARSILKASGVDYGMVPARYMDEKLAEAWRTAHLNGTPGRAFSMVKAAHKRRYNTYGHRFDMDPSLLPERTDIEQGDLTLKEWFQAIITNELDQAFTRFIAVLDAKLKETIDNASESEKSVLYIPIAGARGGAASKFVGKMPKRKKGQYVIVRTTSFAADVIKKLNQETLNFAYDDDLVIAPGAALTDAEAETALVLLNDGNTTLVDVVATARAL